MKKILVVGGGAYQLPLIKRIIELGHEAYCIDGNRDAVGFAYASDHRNIDVLDREACLEYAREIGIDGVMTYGATITLPTVSYIGEVLGLPALPAETAEISKSKFKIKKRLAEYGCNMKGSFFPAARVSAWCTGKKIFAMPFNMPLTVRDLVRYMWKAISAGQSTLSKRLWHRVISTFMPL